MNSNILPRLLCGLTLVSFLTGYAESESVPIFRDPPPHTTIGILGDSITQGVSLVHSKELGRMTAVTDETDSSKFDQGGTWHQYLQLFFATRFPGRNIWTINIGQGGGTATGALERMERDVFTRKGDIMLVMFGINDARYTQLLGGKADEASVAKNLENYKESLAKVVDALLAKGRKVVIVSSSPYEDRNPGDAGGKLNAVLAKFAAAAKNIADQRGLPFVDFHNTLLEVAAQQLAIDSKFKFTADRVHPTAKLGFNEVMAYQVLKQLGAPGIVYAVSLTAAGEVKTAENVEVQNPQSAADGSFQFSLTEKALPFPVSGNNDKGFTYVPFHNELNRQTLQVSGLKPGKYRLVIDEADVGTYASGEFDAGVSLSENEKTPQFQRAMELYDLIRHRKLLLEQWIRVTENNLYNVLKSELRENVDKIDWKDPDAVQAAIAQAFPDGVEKIPGWKGYLLKTSAYVLPRKTEVEKELAGIRAKLAAVPSEFTHKYSLVPVD